MSKAKELLKKRKITLLLIKVSSVLTQKESIEIDGEIKELDEAISELEAQEAKQCKECKFADVDDQACTILTHAVLESDAMPKTFYCSLFEKATK